MSELFYGKDTTIQCDAFIVQIILSYLGVYPIVFSYVETTMYNLLFSSLVWYFHFEIMVL